MNTRLYILEYEPDAERYFDIGHDNKSYCWAWIHNRLLSKKGRTHGLNYGLHNLVNAFKGWYDPQRKKITVAVPHNVTRGNKPDDSDVPNKLYSELIKMYGRDNDMLLF